jgi:hypothetical protein
MSGGARIRTVTLVLEGGHLIKLGGAVDLPALIGYLQEPSRDGDIVEIQSNTDDRLILRRTALLGLIDSYMPYDTKPSETKANDPFPIKPYVAFENFLPATDHQTVIARALELEDKFEVSTVTTGRNDYRNSVMLSEDEIIGPMFRRRIRIAAADVAHSWASNSRSPAVTTSNVKSRPIAMAAFFTRITTTDPPVPQAAC